VRLNGKRYLIGGFVEGWTPTDEVHEYNPANDRWQRLAALPTMRGALAAAVLMRRRAVFMVQNRTSTSKAIRRARRWP
jgi:Galactose oxidase, central domain